MASTLSSTGTDPRFDGGVAPTVAKDRFTGIEEALARLAHQAASDAPNSPPRGPASDKPAEAPTLGPADLRARIPREQRLLGKRGTLARVAIAVCLGASAIFAWRSYGGLIATWGPPFGWTSARPSAAQTPAPRTPDPTPEQATAPPAIETPAPPPAQPASIEQPAQAPSQAASIAQPATTATNEPGAASAERQQFETMARDLVALRQTVEQLAAGQEQLTREIAKLQAEKPQADKPPAEKLDKRTPRRVPTPAAPPVDAPARKPALTTPTPPPPAPQVSTVSPLSPPPPLAAQIPLEPQPADPPPLRPPMPIPQP